MMNVRQRNNVICATAALVGLGGLALLAWGLVDRVEVGSQNDPASRAPVPDQAADGPASDDPAPARFEIAELQRLCARDLRRPLFDPAPKLAEKTATKKAAAKANLSVKLIGTVSEPGHSMAMLLKSDRTFAWCAEGQSIEDRGIELTVTKVDSDRVTVRYGGKVHELELPPKPPMLLGASNR